MENFIIKTDGSKHVIAPKNGKKFELEELQELVGGYIQVIRLNNKDNQCMIVNETANCTTWHTMLKHQSSRTAQKQSSTVTILSAMLSSSIMNN